MKAHVGGIKKQSWFKSSSGKCAWTCIELDVYQAGIKCHRLLTFLSASLCCYIQTVVP